MRVKVDKPAAPGKVGERAPFGGNQRRMIAVFARADDARMLVERKGNIGLQRKPRAFENNLGTEFGRHIRSILL